MCESIIGYGLTADTNPAVIDEGRIDATKRRSRTAWFHCWKPEFKDLTDFLTYYAHQANQSFGLDFNFLPAFQYTEYSAEDQGFYDEHIDLFINENVQHRKISMTLQLSDPATYEGGDLQMIPMFGDPPNPESLRKQGTVLFFPSFVPHKVTPVTKGIRRSLVAWWLGPPFR